MIELGRYHDGAHRRLCSLWSQYRIPLGPQNVYIVGQLVYARQDLALNLPPMRILYTCNTVDGCKMYSV